MKKFSRRPSPAMAVAFIALLAALSGTAVALPGTNSVDSGDLRRNSVTAAKIARGAVTAPKIRNGAVTGPKIRNGAVTAAKVRNNSLTGADINASTLGQVPTANNANHANTANTANHANTATTASNAQTVGGHAASSIVRVASASSNGVALAGVSGTALATAITAPSAGFLVINAGSDVFGMDPDSVNCFIEVDGAQSEPSLRTIQLSAGNTEDNCTTETVVQVAAGDHTVDFEYTAVGATTIVDESSLQVLFVPFGATGAMP